MSLAEQLQVIAAQGANEFRAALMWLCLAGLSAIILGALAWWLGRIGGKVRKWAMVAGPVGVILLAPFVGKMIVYAATKPPTSPHVTFDDYLANNGSAYVTNGTQYVGVNIAWKKTYTSLPDTTPLYISSRTYGSQAAWNLIGTTIVGSSPFNYTNSSVTNLEFFVWHEWVPPTPVHTNGVWLGTVLETARGTTNKAEKMIIIHGQLMNHGKVIAP